jgi:molybdate transport system regulatory protein
LYVLGITLLLVSLPGGIMKRATLIRFRIDFAENSNLGPGKVALLEGIREHGSLSEAARRMAISYRRAWLLVDSLNKSFDTPAAVSGPGGPGGRRSQITPFGVLLIERYRDVERKLNDVAGDSLDEIRKRVNRSAATSTRAVPLSKKRRNSA